MIGAVLWVSLVAAAAPEPVVIGVMPLVVSGDHEILVAADLMRGVELATARRPDVRAAAVSTLDALSGAAGQRLRDCGPDVSCVGPVLRDAGVPVGLLIVVNARVSPAVIAVRAVVGGAVRAERIDSRGTVELPMVDAVARAVSMVLDDLGYVAWAQLTVEAAPPEAQLALDEPQAAQIAPGIWLVPQGTVTITASAPEHVDAHQTIAVAAGEDRTVSLTLDADTHWWQSPWFWAAAGVGVAAGAIGVAAALSGSPNCLCVGHPDAPCVCP